MAEQEFRTVQVKPHLSSTSSLTFVSNRPVAALQYGSFTMQASMSWWCSINTVCVCSECNIECILF